MSFVCSYHIQDVNKNNIIVLLRSYHSYPTPGPPLRCWLMTQVLCDQGKWKVCRCSPGMHRMQPEHSISELNWILKKNSEAELINIGGDFINIAYDKFWSELINIAAVWQLFFSFLPLLINNCNLCMQILWCPLSDHMYECKCINNPVTAY